MQLHFTTIHKQNGNVPYDKCRMSETKHERMPVRNIKICIYHSMKGMARREIYSLIQITSRPIFKIRMFSSQQYAFPCDKFRKWISSIRKKNINIRESTMSASGVIVSYRHAIRNKILEITLFQLIEHIGSNATTILQRLSENDFQKVSGMVQTFEFVY